MTIPIYWLSLQAGDAKIRWDEQHVEQIIWGTQKRSGAMPAVEEFFVTEIPPGPLGIVCFPAGAHDPRRVGWLNNQLARLQRVILFVTSDECSLWPVDLIRHRNIQLWVQTPSPDKKYPQGTIFIGEGAPNMPKPPLTEKDLDVFLAGQSNHERRAMAHEVVIKHVLEKGRAEDYMSAQFLSGYTRDEYLAKLRRTKAAPAPAGACTQDSFRAYEALESGAVPLLDMLRHDGTGQGYWEMVAPALALWLQYTNAASLEGAIASVLEEWPYSAIRAHGTWHHMRRDYSRVLAGQLGLPEWERSITCIIPTSPIPDHPGTSIIAETITSVKARFGDIDTVVVCDGVPRKLAHRRADYDEYVRRLMLLSEAIGNVTPYVMADHVHQAAMTKWALNELVDTEYVLYVEHDTPLTDDIDPTDVMYTMESNGINSMRFYHEKAIHPDHMSLMVDVEPAETFVRTFQWSQRPHLARTDWYRNIMHGYFGSGGISFIEDVMHGIVQDAMPDHWAKFGLAIWTPLGADHIQRSAHLDGRAGDPKPPQKFRYPGNITPPGAPRRDTREG